MGFKPDVRQQLGQAKYFSCLLRQAGVDAEFMPIPGLAHGLSKDPQVSSRIAEFFASQF